MKNRKNPKMYFHVFESFYIFKVVFEIGIESGIIFYAYRNFSDIRGAPESSFKAKLRFDIFLNFWLKLLCDPPPLNLGDVATHLCFELITV